MCHQPNPDLLNGLHEGVYLVDLDCRIRFWNQGAAKISGYLAADVTGKRCADDILVHVDERGERKCGNGCPLRQSMADGQPHEVEVYLLHKNGHRVAVSVRTAPLRDEQGNVVGGIEAFVYSSDHGRRLNELEAIAFTDPLTGLPNRRCLENQLGRAIEDARLTETPLSVIVIDVNDFKTINDTYGHKAGDAVLVTVARTLREAVRSTDLAARWGGDEFVALLPQAAARVAASACERIRALVCQAHTRHKEYDIPVSVSVGYATLAEAENAAALFERADHQLYLDKSKSQAAYLF